MQESDESDMSLTSAEQVYELSDNYELTSIFITNLVLHYLLKANPKVQKSSTVSTMTHSRKSNHTCFIDRWLAVHTREARANLLNRYALLGVLNVDASE